MRFVGCVICCNCFGGGTDISAMVWPIGVKVCTMVELRPEVSSPGNLPCWWRYLQVSQNAGSKRSLVGPFWPLIHHFFCYVTANTSNIENGKSQRYMSIRAEHQLDESFLKM